MEATLAHPVFIDVLTEIIGQNVTHATMLFMKSSGKPGRRWRWGAGLRPRWDRSLTGGWIALDDATVENGCLWVIPGYCRAGTCCIFAEWRGDPRFDCVLEAQGFPYTSADAVPVEVKAGSIVFFNGYLLHRSLPNRAPSGYRRALVNHLT